MLIVDTALARREAAGQPIRVGMIGAGFMARGTALQLVQYAKGMRLVVNSHRAIERRHCAVDVGIGMGVAHNERRREAGLLVPNQ